MQIFTLQEWNEKVGIQPKIKKALESLGITYLYGWEDPDRWFESFIKYTAYKKKLDEWNEDLADYFIYLIGNRMNENHFTNLLYLLKKKVPSQSQNIVVLNGKRNPLFNQFPEGLTILHSFKDNRLTPQPRTYKQKGMYETLKKLFKDVPNLPYQPLKIYGYGSFFRDKDNIRDVDLKFVHDDNNPRWQRFYNFFKERSKEYRKFMSLVIKEYRIEELKLNQTKLNQIKLNQTESNRIISLQEKCEEEGFKKILDKYNMDKDLLKYFTWGEFFGFKTFHKFFPNIDNLFLRMFRKNKKGIHAHPTINGLNDGKVYVLLWSKEYPSFEINYAQWKEKNKEQYIKDEYSHLITELIHDIKFYEDKISSIETIDPAREFAIREFTKLQTEFPPNAANSESFEELNRKTNALREKTKALLNEIERLETKKRLNNVVREKQDRYQKTNDSKP